MFCTTDVVGSDVIVLAFAEEPVTIVVDLPHARHVKVPVPGPDVPPPVVTPLTDATLTTASALMPA
jgi:hypothetical protein